MRSAVYTVLTSVLLLAPISAVPLMAIFGVPQFTPVVASPLDDADEDDADWDKLPRKSSRSKTAENRPDDEEADLFEEDALDWDEPAKDRLKPMKKPRTRSRAQVPDEEIASAPPDELEPAPKVKSKPPAGKPPRRIPPSAESADVLEFASSESNEDSTGPGVGHANFEREIEETPKESPAKPAGAMPSYRRTRPDGAADRPSEKATGRSKRTPSSGEPLTWSKAVVRLNELGIRNFKLEPGMRPGEFTFTCSYTPTNSPHVTRRFEAEADDPLKAVAQVLSQVERWAQQRDATSKRTAERPHEVN